MTLRASRPIPGQADPAKPAALPARTATVRMVEVASRRPAVLRRPAISRAAIAPVQAPPRSEPRSYPDRGSANRSPNQRACKQGRVTARVARPGWPPSAPLPPIPDPRPNQIRAGAKPASGV